MSNEATNQLDHDPEYEQRLRRAEGKEEPADYRGTLVTRRSAPKLTVTTEYGTFSRRTWREYEYIVVTRVWRGGSELSARASAWSFSLEGARKALRREAKWARPVPGGEISFSIHRVSDGVKL